MQAEIVVIGSGAGGAITAATLAEAGRDVLVLEEGPPVDPELGTNSPEAMRSVYRNAGLSPILGRVPIAFVEGRCVGGSTEINSSFWHRPPRGAVERWRDSFGVRDLGHDDLDQILDEIEKTLQPTVTRPGELPASSAVFRRGLEGVGTEPAETPRLQGGDASSSQFAPGAKRSMSRTFLPRAEAAGARIESGCRVRRIHHRDGRATSLSVERGQGRSRHRFEVHAETVFVCGGAIQTPALLRASGIRRRIGDSLRIQPMLKAAAEFDEILDAHRSVMPVYQLREAESSVFLGGSVFTPGFLGMALSDRWPENESLLRSWRRMGLYYAACRGSAKGSVRAFPGTGEAIVRYGVSREDRQNLVGGLARLCDVLFAGGARCVVPGLRGRAPFRSAAESRRVLESPIAASDLNLSTVHVSSSCPMGEIEATCPVDSYGRLRDFENLHLGDASVIPDAPGVNPQGTVMALALRNARHFLSGADARA
jgi:choline dehydrogenase-like flavoprotein